jgi:amidohydrolase
MDALPIDEPEGLPFRSGRPGIMHACGHDAHSAVVAGLARILAPLADRLPGTIKLLFQPAEEGGMGAQAMIEAGALDHPRVDAILGFHVFPGLPTGEVSVYRGPSHASADTFAFTFRGKGGHAGYPHLCRDPLGPACEWVVALKALIARETDPLDAAVATVGAVRGGDAPNVTPETAEVRGTLRCLDEDLRARLKRRLVETAEGLAAAHRVEVEARFEPGCPANRNDPRVADLVGEQARAVLGAGAVKSLPPAMGAEDFACFTRVVPGAMFRLGCAAPGAGPAASLHSPRFALDEACMEHAAVVLARAAWCLVEAGLPLAPPGTSP